MTTQSRARYVLNVGAALAVPLLATSCLFSRYQQASQRVEAGCNSTASCNEMLRAVRAAHLECRAEFDAGRSTPHDDHECRSTRSAWQRAMTTYFEEVLQRKAEKQCFSVSAEAGDRAWDRCHRLYLDAAQFAEENDPALSRFPREAITDFGFNVCNHGCGGGHEECCRIVREHADAAVAARQQREGVLAQKQVLASCGEECVAKRRRCGPALACSKEYNACIDMCNSAVR